MNQTASDFITNVICPVSIYKDPSTGVSYPGFRYYVDGEGHHFKRSSLYDNISSAKTYSIKFGQQNSNVISFSLSGAGIMVMANAFQDSDGALLGSMSALDKIYGQSVYQDYIGVSNVNNVDNQVKLYTDSNLLTTSMVKIKSSSTQTGLSATYNEVLDNIKTFPFEATLTIWGEYSADIAPGNWVSLVVLDSTGREHYATGTYYIIEVQDEVSSNGFIQTLTLFKKSDKFMEGLLGKSNNNDDTTGESSGTHSYTPAKEADKLQKVDTDSSLSNERVQNANNSNYWGKLNTSEPIPITNQNK